MSTRAVAIASDPYAAEAATALLVRGNAVDALVAGVFAAAAGADTVLLGPVQLLLGGAGLGLRAIDGRNLQPGKGVARPRGFQSDEPVPGSAHVGVPGLPAALAAALATSGNATMTQVMAPALARAEGERKALLQRIVHRGPACLADDVVGDELVAACGRIAGGVLTREDLEGALPKVVPAETRTLPGGRKVMVAPWRAGAILDGEAPVDAGQTRVCAVVDAKGLLAIACYEAPVEGLELPALGVRAPRTASPVLRGQTRVRPGDVRPAPAPIALSESDGVYDLALGIALASQGEPALGELLERIGEGTGFDAITESERGDVLGIARSRAGASLIRSARRG